MKREKPSFYTFTDERGLLLSTIRREGLSFEPLEHRPPPGIRNGAAGQGLNE